jgi:Fur family peroxide stress response transcriptional regulator
MAIKHSRQRDTIMHFLQSRKDHPTADEIYHHVRETIPNISLGTVYRNLTLLADRGEILRLHVGDGVDHFDADTSPHYHFVCRECGSIEDMDMAYDDSLDKAALASIKGQLEGHFVYFYGKCENCRKKAQK